MMRSFDRSNSVRNPSPSSAPRSPVCSHPCASAAADASGLRQYPRITVGPRTRTSPTDPAGSAAPSGSAITTSIPVCALPTDAIRASSPRAIASASSARPSAVIVIGDSPWP